MGHTLTATSGGTFRKLFVRANTRVEKRQIYGTKLVRVASTNPEQKQLGHVVEEVVLALKGYGKAGMVDAALVPARTIDVEHPLRHFKFTAWHMSVIAGLIACVLRTVANTPGYFINRRPHPLDRTSHWPNTLAACSRDVVEHVEDHDAREIVWAAIVACCHRLTKGRDDDRLNVGGGCHGQSLRPALHPVQGNGILPAGSEGGTQRPSTLN